MRAISVLSGVLGLALVLAGPAPAQTVVSPAVPATKYEFDTTHSSVEFVVRFMGLSRVRGRFADFDGTILLDETRPENATVSLVFDVASIDTDSDVRDRHLRSPDWFDADSHPVITFQSRTIERRSDDEFVVRGPLTIRGTTKDVEVPVTMEVLEEVVEQEGVAAAVKRFHELGSERPDDYNFAEAEINKLGYKLLQRDRPRDAVEIFELNLSAHPESTNAYDSLGEAHAAAGNREAAIENYEKVVAADPHATGAIEMLRWLRDERSRVTLIAR